MKLRQHRKSVSANATLSAALLIALAALGSAGFVTLGDTIAETIAGRADTAANTGTTEHTTLPSIGSQTAAGAGSFFAKLGKIADEFLAGAPRKFHFASGQEIDLWSFVNNGENKPVYLSAIARTGRTDFLDNAVLRRELNALRHLGEVAFSTHSTNDFGLSFHHRLPSEAAGEVIVPFSQVFLTKRLELGLTDTGKATDGLYLGVRTEFQRELHFPADARELRLLFSRQSLGKPFDTAAGPFSAGQLRRQSNVLQWIEAAATSGDIDTTLVVRWDWATSRLLKAGTDPAAEVTELLAKNLPTWPRPDVTTRELSPGHLDVEATWTRLNDEQITAMRNEWASSK